MIRFLGFVIIVMSSAKIGFDASYRYIGRVKELKSFIKVLEKLRNEIEFSNCVISEALLNSANVKSSMVNKLINHIVTNIENGKNSMCEAFVEFVSLNRMYFYKNDVDEICGYLSSFGSGDTKEEIENITKTIGGLKSNLGVAIENERKYVKFFRTSGILTGFLIAIILA